MTTDREIGQEDWDCCVIGNGVSALWLSHWLWSGKRSVIWITSEEPYGSERGMLQHGWLWCLGEASAQRLTRELQGFDAGEPLPPFEMQYHDARSKRRFLRWGEAKQEWGAHEQDYFARIGSVMESSPLDLWGWHNRLHAFHDGGGASGPSQIELFREPRFHRVHGWPVNELKTEDGRIVAAVLARLGEVRAKRFYLGDFDEHLPALIRDTEAARSLGSALKGRQYQAGFGLRFWHRDTGLQLPESVCVVPLVVNPAEASEASHVMGRLRKNENGPVQSFWVGLLTDEELEDNNEILKKMKQAKRAIDRAIPGFAAGIEREAVSFEPRMFAFRHGGKKRATTVLGAALFSDQDGPEGTIEVIRAVAGDEQSPVRSQISEAVCQPGAE